jgi:hypothetical protein
MSKLTTIVDTEIYQDYFLAGFKDTLSGRYVDFEMYEGKPLDLVKLSSFMRRFRLITFNGSHFDIPILALALTGADCALLKKACDAIINGNMKSWIFEKAFGVRIPKLDHIDLIDVAPGIASLKVYGGRLHAPKMQDLPIEPNELILPEERPIIVSYNHNDLDTTEALFNKMAPQISLRERMTEHYGVDLRSKSDAQIAEAVLASQVEKITGVKPERPEILPGTIYHYRAPDWVAFRGEALRDMLADVQRADFRVIDNGSIVEPPELKGRKVKIGARRLPHGHRRPALQRDARCARGRARRGHRRHRRGQLLPRADPRPGAGAAPDGRRLHPGLSLDRAPARGRQGRGRQGHRRRAEDCRERVLRQVRLEVVQALRARPADPDHGDGPARAADADRAAGGGGHRGAERQHRRHRDALQADALVDRMAAWWSRVGGQHGLETERNVYAALYSRDVNNYFALKPDGSAKLKGVFADAGLAKNPETAICVEAALAWLRAGAPIDKSIRACRDLSKFVAIRKVQGGAVKDGEYLGKAVRWYYAAGETGTINYKVNGYKVPSTDGARPCMEMPSEFPADVDYSWYERETLGILEDVGALDRWA